MSKRKQKIKALRAQIQKLKAAIDRITAKIIYLKHLPRKPKPSPAKVSPTVISARGVKFIAEFEGFFSHVYNDPAGHCTIGYGTLLHLGNCTSADKKKWKDGISREKALDMLKEEADKAGSVVRDYVEVPLNQNQFDALVSFAYNCGVGAFMSSTLLRKLNNGDYASVPSELNRWVRAGSETLPGLVRRRKAEGDLFMKKP